MEKSHPSKRRQFWSDLLFRWGILVFLAGGLWGFVSLSAVSDGTAAYQQEKGIPMVWMSAGMASVGLFMLYLSERTKRPPDAP